MAKKKKDDAAEDGKKKSPIKIIGLCVALALVGAGVLWTSQGIYMSRCAAREARATGEKVDDVTGRFNGIFWAGFQLKAKGSSILKGRLEKSLDPELLDLT
jgi:hypothetical protein